MSSNLKIIKIIARLGVELRTLAYEANILPISLSRIKYGCEAWDRTKDLLINNQRLYLLSYFTIIYSVWQDLNLHRLDPRSSG
jgi:hypothetical protein